ncbi:MAG: ABC transporter permease [Armatimonadetes bacterium]|nr:ABC transporter permease [Armatimonadota bacterium]
MSLRRVVAIARAEGLLLRRDPRSLAVIFLLPVILLILYGYGLNFDLHNLPTGVLDLDRSDLSREIIQRAAASGYFSFVADFHRHADLVRALRKRQVLMVLVIPPGFTARVVARKQAQLELCIDGCDAVTAGTAIAYANRLLARITQEELRHRAARLGLPESLLAGIAVHASVLYNPGLDSAAFIVPGLMGVVMALMAALLTSTCIVREREVGTIEALLATPIQPAELLVGKLLPYAAVAMIDIGLLALAGAVVFDVLPRGSFLQLFLLSAVFIAACLFIGIAISGRAGSQRIAIVGGLLSLMLPTIILSGFVFPLANFPWALKGISYILPATHYLVGVRAIYLRGVSPIVFWPNTMALVGEAVLLFLVALKLFRARL